MVPKCCKGSKPSQMLSMIVKMCRQWPKRTRSIKEQDNIGSILCTPLAIMASTPNKHYTGRDLVRSGSYPICVSILLQTATPDAVAHSVREREREMTSNMREIKSASDLMRFLTGAYFLYPEHSCFLGMFVDLRVTEYVICYMHP